MKMDIVESDLKELWVLCDSQQALIEILEERIDDEHSHYVYGYEKLEKRINNIEHDLQLVISSSVKNRKNST
jgi:Na+/phosphate symporter